MVEKLILNNGVRIVHEKLDHVRSVALGVWVVSGSRHEPENLCGVSHFIEHMLFKGTEQYTAPQLAQEFDTVGGQVNAFTTKENTCFYVRTLDTHLQKAAKLLWDMYFNSKFAQEDIDLERGVIIEEIGMYEDTPEDLVNELLFAKVYQGCSLARPILGTVDSLKAMDGATLKKYRAQNYTPKNTVISLSGSFTPEDLQFIVSLFDAMPDLPAPRLEEAPYKKGMVIKEKDIEQNHLIVAFPGIDLHSEERHAMQVMNNILGAGMSSRLFQRVREQSGLCYTIYSFSSLYTGAGLYGVYTALGKETEMKALELIAAELTRFRDEGVTDDELGRTKNQLTANVLMGLESTNSRMSSIARNELIWNRHIYEEETVAKLEKVRKSDIQDLAARILNFDQMSFSAVGHVSKEEDYLSVLHKQ